MADPLTADELADLARDPLSHAVDGEQTVSRSADDIIKLDKYGKEVDAAEGPVKTAWARVRMARAIPPGAGPNG